MVARCGESCMSSNSRYQSARQGAIARSVWQSPLGSIEILASGRGLRLIEFISDDEVSPRPPEESDEDSRLAAQSIVTQAQAQLEEYFAGARRRFELAVDLNGTAFQRAVWDQLQRIPYGETITYRSLAALAGRPAAIRAAGAANGANPLAIVVPCHRVVGADGSLTGYAGGVERKRTLLDLEARGCRLP